MSHVSVIIPVRNREHLLQKCVQSVLAQTYQDLEIIIVNDGSTDQTAQVMARLAEESKRVRCLQHSSSRGAQSARNTGIRAASGDWLAFLDSDDLWFPESLNVRLQRATQSKSHVVHSECYVLTPESSELRPFEIPQMEGFIYKEILRRPGPMFQGLLVSKAALERVGLLDETIVSYQEWDTAIRLAKHYEFQFVREPTYIYDCRRAGTISKDLLRAARGYEQVFTKHFRSLFFHVGPSALAAHYETAASLYRRANDENSAQRCLKRAFLLCRLSPQMVLTGVNRFLKSRR